MKVYRTYYTNGLKNKIRNYAESANLDSVIVGVEINAIGDTVIVVEGENAQVDMVIKKLGTKGEPKKAKVRKKPESEIFYTGGGIWCGVIPLGNGTWASGELNDWLTIYKTKTAAVECQGENDPNFIRYTTEKDFAVTMDLWKKAIEHEKTACNGLSAYCDDWMRENRRIKSIGNFEY